ncbi:MAG: hypothetical protein FWF94_05565 [Oscillospiraceae bacterium]|nr:hypothetical protein [Oscillospiraceae bacterium]
MEERLFEKYTKTDSYIEDESALEAVFASLDDAFEQGYGVNMRYYQFYITDNANTEQRYVINISKIKVGNLNNAMNTLEERRDKFDNIEAFNATAKMLLYVFTQGKDTIAFLKEIKNQGGGVELYLEAGEKPRFSIYGNRFLLPGKTTFSQLSDIIGDINTLADSGVLVGRRFDVPFIKVRYSFNMNKVKNLPGIGNAELNLEDVFSRLFVCGLKSEKIALINDNDEISDIITVADLTGEKREAYTQSNTRLILFKDDYLKSEIADILEIILTGENNSIISDSLAKKVPPNYVLNQTEPFYNRKLPEISSEDFTALRNEINRINGLNLNDAERTELYRNRFAEDFNENMPGYGGYCPVCGIEINTINSYKVKDFNIEMISGMDGTEKVFRFSLYMCANEYYTADGWIIEDLSIGGMNPFTWLEEVASAGTISPELLQCSIRMITRYTDAPLKYDKENEGEIKWTAPGEIFSTPQTIKDFNLAPLMAAKWVEDNMN